MAVPLIVSHAPHLGAEVGTNAQTHTCAVNMHMPQAYAYTHMCIRAHADVMDQSHCIATVGLKLQIIYFSFWPQAWHMKVPKRGVEWKQ